MPRIFVKNDAGIDELAIGPEIRAALRAEAERAKAIAESIAPRDTGHYAASFDVAEETLLDFAGEGPRAAARVTNTADYAAAVEWGNEQTPRPHRVLGRVLDTLGE